MVLIYIVLRMWLDLWSGIVDCIVFNTRCRHYQAIHCPFWGQNFLLVDLREFFFRVGGWGGGGKKKINKKALKMTS